MPKDEQRPTGGAGGDRARIRLSKRSTAVVRGEEDVSTWDWEELRRGRPRSADGVFRGPDPKIIPRACFEEMYRRVISVAERKLLEALPEVVDALIAIIKADGVDESTRLRAIQYAVDRVMGKPEGRETVDVRVRQAPWETALMNGIVGTDAAAGDVIDAEVIEEDDIDWDDV